MKLLKELRSKLPDDAIKKACGTEIAGTVRGSRKAVLTTRSNQVLERIG